MKKAASRIASVVALVIAMAMPALAQDNYPSAVIRIVVGFPPGGSVDVIARLLMPKLSTQMDTPVIVENKPGANTNIAAESVARSKPDGYTLFVNSSANVLSTAFGEKMGYDLLRDLAPVSFLVSIPKVVIVHPSVPANTITEFISYLRANPDKLAYGTAGIGSSNHLATLLFLQRNGLSALHVPYKGGKEYLTDAAAGRVQFGIQQMSTVAPLVRDRRLKTLAITSLTRSPLLPDVPALAETMPEFEVSTWNGVLVPAKTPPAIIKRLNAEIVKALRDPELIARLSQDGTEVRSSTPEEYGAYIKSELDRWTKTIKVAGIKAE